MKITKFFATELLIFLLLGLSFLIALGSYLDSQVDATLWTVFLFIWFWFIISGVIILVKFMRFLLVSYGYVDALNLKEKKRSEKHPFVSPNLTVSEYQDIWEDKGYVIKRFIVWVLLLTFTILLVDNSIEEDRPWGLVFLPLYILVAALMLFVVLKYTSWGEHIPSNPIFNDDFEGEEKEVDEEYLDNFKPQTAQQLYFFVCYSAPELVLGIRIFMIFLFLSLLISLNVQLDRNQADRVSWAVVLIPTYIFLLFYFIVILYMYYMLPVFKRWNAFWSAIWNTLCFVAFTLSFIFIAIQLDDPSVFGSWVNVFIPAYVWFLLAFFYVLFIVLIDHNMVCFRKRRNEPEEIDYLDGMIATNKGNDMNPYERSEEESDDYEDDRMIYR